MSINMASFSVVSEIAMVPDSEWRIPTLIVSSAALAGADINRPAATTLAENIFVIVAKLPLMRKTPKLVDCTATLQCNPHANRIRHAEKRQIDKRYQAFI
ncbi:hypothetical protein, partial [Mesorhizobium intechi]|uniref:hypothetical protein n=1 Tax=Mesorhizobium intechi TaxID=537601 RepID=UPI001FE57384